MPILEIYRDGLLKYMLVIKVLNTKESLPSSHTGAGNIQEKLQLSGKDNEEEMVVELGTSNGSCMDSLKKVEQKTDLVVEVSPSNEDISVISISPKHDIDDARPPSDDDLDLAPKSTSKIQLSNYVGHLSGAAGLGEKNSLSGQIENSTEKYPHLKPAVGVKDSVPNKTGEMKNLQTLESDSSDWDSTSLSLSNEAGQRAEHLKLDKCPLVSQSVTTNQSAPTELRQTALVGKDRMNIGAMSLSENAARRGLCESQLPENRSSKEADLDLERTSEEKQERLDGSENNHSQVKEQINSVDGLDDLTLPPETASEDCESLYPNCKDTLRLIEQLGLESEDSDRLLKIQDPVHSFRSIEPKESDYELLRGKIKEMENKVNWLQTELLKTREAKSQLKLQNVECERELCSMRFMLKQETKKKKNYYMLYENTKDDLKRKEKQYSEQVYLNQQLENTVRALECKLKSIRNKPNQVLEERSDAQRQLSREQNAGVIQDEILAHHLSQQKEAEKANEEMNAEDTMDFELSDSKDNREVLPQQLSEAESQFRGQEIELHPRRDALRPTTLVLESVHRDRGQAQCSTKQTEPLSQSKEEKVNKYIGKQAFLEKRVCELQNENMLLRQQLDVAQNEAKSKKIILNIPEPFPDHLGKLEAMSKRILMLEEGNKELIDEFKCLKDRLYQYVTDRAEMEAHMRQLQQERTDTRKKVSMLEASLEVTAHHPTNSENKRQDGERKPHQTANPVCMKSSTSANADLPAKVESVSSVLLHLSAETQLLKELYL
nr:ankyrin repeat domain-containing protein 26-like isoform X10 [Vicugna pacos]